MEALGKALFRLKGWKGDSWDKFYLERRPIAEVVEAMSTDKLNSLRGCSRPQLAGTYRWVCFLSDTQRTVLFTDFDAKSLLCERRFEASEAQWASFSEKLRKRNLRSYAGADDYYIRGVSAVDLSSESLQAVSHSDPVLPGGLTVRRAAVELSRTKLGKRSAGATERMRESRAKAREERALELRALAGELPGDSRAELPESLRVLYGNCPETTGRLDAFFSRVEEVDAYLQSFKFGACDFCEEGWFGTDRPMPRGEESHMNFRMASAADRDLLGERNVCARCLWEAQKPPSGTSGGARAPQIYREPSFWTSANDMSIGPTFPAIDALTYFEEQLVAPIQPMVRIFTLYSTGLTEMRGHVANWHQGGPQWVRDLPVKASEAGILLIRRFPKDPQRKQRLPFLVSRGRLEAALQQLCKPVAEGGHRAYQKDAWPNGGVRVNPANLAEYDEASAEPAGLQVVTVDQREGLIVGMDLFSRWLDEGMVLQLNLAVRAHVLNALEDVAGTGAEWLALAWEHVRAEIRNRRGSVALCLATPLPRRPRIPFATRTSPTGSSARTLRRAGRRH